MFPEDPRIDEFNIAFHKEMYGPDNKGESFESQRWQEIAMLRQAYWVRDTTFLGAGVKRSFVSAQMMFASINKLSSACNERLIGVLDDLLHTATQ